MVPDTAEAILRITCTLGGDRRASERRRRHSDGRIGRRQAAARHRAKAFPRTAARPDAGVNAVAVLCDALLLLDHQEDQVDVIQQIHAWAEDTTGAHWASPGRDDVAGPLTSNLGIAELENGRSRSPR